MKSTVLVAQSGGRSRGRASNAASGAMDDSTVEIERARDTSTVGRDRAAGRLADHASLLHQLDDEAVSADRARADLPPRIGRFTLRRILGEGGMGLVVEALDVEEEDIVCLDHFKLGLLAKSAVQTGFAAFVCWARLCRAWSCSCFPCCSAFSFRLWC